MGVETAFAQFIADELDVPIGRVSFVMGDTARTADQGGVGGSTSVSLGSTPLRNAAATARRLLVESASRRLGVPADSLVVHEGVVSVKGRAGRRVTYASLVSRGGLNGTLKVSGAGFALAVEGAGKPKDPSQFRVVGTSVPRRDLASKVHGTFTYVTDVRVPGMLHGRVVRPAGVGASVVSVDERAAKAIPGYVRAVVKGDFVGVVAETEWAAIRAAEALRVTWSAASDAFPGSDELYAHMRAATPKATRETMKRGDAAAALAAAATRVEARYDFPFQSHATMGPGCAVADVRADGVTTVWSGAQKPHALQRGLAQLLGVPDERVRVVWVEDAGSYGRPGFEDAAADAAAALEGGRAARARAVDARRHDGVGHEGAGRAPAISPRRSTPAAP